MPATAESSSNKLFEVKAGQELLEFNPIYPGP